MFIVIEKNSGYILIAQGLIWMQIFGHTDAGVEKRFYALQGTRNEFTAKAGDSVNYPSASHFRLSRDPKPTIGHRRGINTLSPAKQLVLP